MKKLVILDSGHAEHVSGKQAPDKSLREWDLNNKMQYKLKKRCEEHEIDVYLTNPSPENKGEMGLTKRADLANSYWRKKDKPSALFISIHSNAYLGYFNSARGTETYVARNASSNSRRAARDIQDEIYKEMKRIDSSAKDRGVKTEDFTVIYKAQMPSILIEYGFYTNKDDLKILKNNVDELVEATMKGICEYFDISYKPRKTETPKPPKPSQKDVYYRVVVGSYEDKSNAEDMKKELKDKGYDPFITTYEP
ncbi:MAG: N-acetylmuramoyl-L-alanine amidase [Peptostreptococcaceae bacterium]